METQQLLLRTSSIKRKKKTCQERQPTEGDRKAIERMDSKLPLDQQRTEGKCLLHGAHKIKLYGQRLHPQNG